MSLSESGDAVVVSSIDFWGRRQDTTLDLGQLVPLTLPTLGDMMKPTMLKLHCYNLPKPLLFFPRLATIPDATLLHAILTRSNPPPATPASAAAPSRAESKPTPQGVWIVCVCVCVCVVCVCVCVCVCE
jgi:hypothetical protein